MKYCLILFAKKDKRFNIYIKSFALFINFVTTFSVQINAFKQLGNLRTKTSLKFLVMLSLLLSNSACLSHTSRIQQECPSRPNVASDSSHGSWFHSQARDSSLQFLANQFPGSRDRNLCLQHQFSNPLEERKTILLGILHIPSISASLASKNV